MYYDVVVVVVSIIYAKYEIVNDWNVGSKIEELNKKKADDGSRNRSRRI